MHHISIFIILFYVSNILSYKNSKINTPQIKQLLGRSASGKLAWPTVLKFWVPNWSRLGYSFFNKKKYFTPFRTFFSYYILKWMSFKTTVDELKKFSVFSIIKLSTITITDYFQKLCNGSKIKIINYLQWQILIWKSLNSAITRITIIYLQ